MNNPSAGPSSKPRSGASQPSETSSKRKRGVFQKESSSRKCGTYGGHSCAIHNRFGQHSSSIHQVHKAQDIGSKPGKLSVEDFLYLIRKDYPKLNRCTELLSMNEELKQARKAFETDEEKLRKAFEADEE